MSVKSLFGKAFLLFIFAFICGCNTATEPYKVMVLGDLHYDAPQYHAPKTKPRNYVAMWKNFTPLLLKKAASHLDKSFPFVLQLGDLTNGDADTVEHQKQMLNDGFYATKKFFPNHKLLAMKGNHDVRLAMKNGYNNNLPAAVSLLPLIAKEAGLPELKTNNYALTQGEDLYLFADGFDYTFDTVKFVKEQLDAHPKARYIFFATHLPVFPASYGKPWWLLPKYGEIAKLLASRNAIVLAGHTHAFSIIVYEFPGIGTLTQLITTSVALNWDKVEKLIPRCKSYADFAAAMTKSKKTDGMKKILPVSGYKTYISYPSSCKGYTILNITDEAVTALLYNGPNAKPHTVVLQKRK